MTQYKAPLTGYTLNQAPAKVFSGLAGVLVYKGNYSANLTIMKTGI
jgi:hypothetical protein